MDREDVDWLRQESCCDDESVEVSELAQGRHQLRMENSKRSEGRIEAMAQVEADSDHRNSVPSDVNRILENFEYEPVKIAHLDAIDRRHVDRPVLEGDQVQDNEHEKDRAMESHELRLKARFLLAIRWHRVFLWTRSFVFVREPEAVDDMEKERDHKTCFRDVQKRVCDEGMAVLVVRITVEDDE